MTQRRLIVKWQSSAPGSSYLLWIGDSWIPTSRYEVEKALEDGHLVEYRPPNHEEVAVPSVADSFVRLVGKV